MKQIHFVSGSLATAPRQRIRAEVCPGTHSPGRHPSISVTQTRVLVSSDIPVHVPLIDATKMGFSSFFHLKVK